LTTGSLKQNPCTASVAASFNHGPKVNLTYDLSNRVNNLAHNGWSEDYLYSPDNRRIWRSAGQTFCGASIDNDEGLSWNPGTGAQSQYILYSPAGQKLGVYCLNFSSSGQYNVWTASEENVYWGSRLVGKRSGAGAMGHFITDRLHSKGDGSAFYPYGESKTGAAGDDREQFATYTRDQTSGLDYADQRWYSSRLGRFTSPDPSEHRFAKMQSPGSWNRYSYVEGEPIGRKDPSGLAFASLEAPPGFVWGAIDVWGLYSSILWFDSTPPVPLPIPIGETGVSYVGNSSLNEAELHFNHEMYADLESMLSFMGATGTATFNGSIVLAGGASATLWEIGGVVIRVDVTAAAAHPVITVTVIGVGLAATAGHILYNNVVKNKEVVRAIREIERECGKRADDEQRRKIQREIEKAKQIAHGNGGGSDSVPYDEILDIVREILCN
jgi:RHS repeat-associated protein